MKTAMQELMDKVQSINERYELKEDANWLMNEIIDLIENSFEKEKEDIIEARDGRETSSFTTGKDYYDLNFNHHIEPEPNTYTNFTPHNANAVAEYIQGLKNLTPSDKDILLTPKGTLTIGEEYSSPSISFYKNNEVEDVVTIHYTKFMYKGEEIKDLQTIYNIIKSLTSIELPSDEEIEQEAQKRHPYEKHMGATWENGLHEGFIMGAEWMKEQILNQNK